MTKQEIFDEPIWPSRLIFNAKFLFGKPWKDCDEDEQLAVRLRSLGIDKTKIQ